MKRIVVFGRTGAGKSSLANKIFGPDNFKEGHSLFSETQQPQEKAFFWPLDKNTQVSWVDTPGFADNRPDTSNQKIINNIFDLLKGLKNGFDVAIFCIAAKSRIDSIDMDEIELIKNLLGAGVFKHMWIAITRINTFEEEARRDYYQKIPNELPEILQNAKIPITRDRILFADFLDFDSKFLNPLNAILRASTRPYLPTNSEKLHVEERNGSNFLYSSEMQAILAQYRDLFQQSEQQLVDNVNQLKKAPSNAFTQKQVQKREKEIQQLREKMQHFDKLILEASPSPSLSKGLGILEKHNLVESWPTGQSLTVTVLQGDKKDRKEHKKFDHPPHESEDEMSDSYRWIIGVQHGYPNITYSFKKCPWSKSCLIFQVQEKVEDLLSANPERKDVIDLKRLHYRQNAGQFLVLTCELRLSEKRFYVYYNNDLYSSISY